MSTVQTTEEPGAAEVHTDKIARVLMPAGSRPRRAGPLSASLTYGWRALLKIKHVPEQLFDVTIFPIMMTVMFTYIFGGAIAGSVDGYVQWLIPGIFVQTLIMITMYTGLTLNRDISKGVFDRFRSLPTWRPAQLVGALLGDQVRYTLAGVIILAVGFVMGFGPTAEPGVCWSRSPCSWCSASACPGCGRSSPWRCAPSRPRWASPCSS